MAMWVSLSKRPYKVGSNSIEFGDFLNMCDGAQDE